MRKFAIHAEKWGTHIFSTFSVIEGVHVSADVTLQVAVKVGGGRKESKADGHQLPASLQTVVAEILRRLTTQLNVKLIAQALVTPPAHHHLAKTEHLSGKCVSPTLNTYSNK